MRFTHSDVEQIIDDAAASHRSKGVTNNREHLAARIIGELIEAEKGTEADILDPGDGLSVDDRRDDVVTLQ